MGNTTSTKMNDDDDQSQRNSRHSLNSVAAPISPVSIIPPSPIVGQLLPCVKDSALADSPPTYDSIYKSDLCSVQAALLAFESHVLDDFKFDHFLHNQTAWRESCQQANTVPHLIVALQNLECGMRWTSVIEEWREARSLWISICDHLINRSDANVRHVRALLAWFEQHTGLQAFTSEWLGSARNQWLLQLLRR